MTIPYAGAEQRPPPKVEGMSIRGRRILQAKRLRSRAVRQRDRISVGLLTARINRLARGVI
jgi:hypothetical protein